MGWSGYEYREIPTSGPHGIYPINRRLHNPLTMNWISQIESIQRNMKGYSSYKLALVFNDYVFIWNEDNQNCFSGRWYPQNILIDNQCV